MLSCEPRLSVPHKVFDDDQAIPEAGLVEARASRRLPEAVEQLTQPSLDTVSELEQQLGWLVPHA
jgi:hypothetical protein